MEIFARAEDCRFGRNGLAEDAVMALDLYHQAANGTGEGAGAALFALAEVYREGGEGGAPLAVKRDLRRAAALYNESAAAGNAAGQFAMGVLFSSGLFGVTPDQDKVRLLVSPYSVWVWVCEAS
jgi:localization factor PodJL